MTSRFGVVRQGSPARRLGGTEVSEDINVVALVKGEERYVFLFDDENRARTLRTLGRYASDPELSFSWYDAAVLSQKIRRQEMDNNPVHNRVFVSGARDDTNQS